MKLYIIAPAGMTTHAPRIEEAPSNHLWGKPLEGTMCGLPKHYRRAALQTFKEVEGHMPSCRMCQNLMAHWAKETVQ
jgi:hypothetical protein